MAVGIPLANQLSQKFLCMLESPLIPADTGSALRTKAAAHEGDTKPVHVAWKAVAVPWPFCSPWSGRSGKHILLPPFQKHHSATRRQVFTL